MTRPLRLPCGQQKIPRVTSDSDLFSEPPGDGPTPGSPLADRMRPRTLDDFVGQHELVGPGSPLRRLIEEDNLCSMIFWGPPGCGKTTLALIIARQTRAEFVPLSAVTATIKDARSIMEQARLRRQHQGRRTILFVDEIHRFNKAQQDAFLPFVEDGSIVLIGATTENPSFSVISALMSRCKVFVLKSLTTDDLESILRAALADAERGLKAEQVDVSDEVITRIASLADGDARRALNLLELAAGVSAKTEDSGRKIVTIDGLRQVLQRQQLVYDKTGEEHYNLMSALHKSMRGSEPQAAAYWAQRMLSSGEDPLYLARRMIRFASEDIGNADPQALTVALAAREAYSILGSPEGDLALLQCAIYLATAPKSNAVYMAEQRIRAEIERTGSLPVPPHLRNAPTGLMKSLGYGAGYQYDHDCDGGIAGQHYLPDGVTHKTFYEPRNTGFEKEIARRMAWWEERRRRRADR
jgi:putative ATPase